MRVWCVPYTTEMVLWCILAPIGGNVPPIENVFFLAPYTGGSFFDRKNPLQWSWKGGLLGGLFGGRLG